MKLSKNAVLLLFLSEVKLTLAAKCPFGYDSETDVKESWNHPRVLSTVSNANYPSDLFTCKAGTQASKTTTFSSQLYEEIVDSIIKEYEKLPATESDNLNPRATFAGCLVRTAGHDFMDFRIKSDGTKQGGSDGCINFNDADNTGLAQCLYDANMVTLYESYCTKVSLADFLVIAAEAIMGRTASNYDASNRYANGSFMNVLKQNFKYGRTTASTCSWNVGLMPNPEDSCDGLKTIFVDNIYKAHSTPWKMVAAINGAHTLGSAKVSNSGYNGFWSESNQQGKFNNDYYKSLLLKGWGPEPAVNGNTAKNQWKRIDEGESLSHKQIMLNSDLCMVFKNNNEKTLHATNDKNCCTWIESDDTREAFPNFTNQEPYCGTTLGQANEDNERNLCCSGAQDCDSDDDGSGPARIYVHDFIRSENAFLLGYLDAWTMATENNFSTLTAIGDSSKVLNEYVPPGLNESGNNFAVPFAFTIGTLLVSIYA